MLISQEVKKDKELKSIYQGKQTKISARLAELQALKKKTSAIDPITVIHNFYDIVGSLTTEGINAFYKQSQQTQHAMIGLLTKSITLTALLPSPHLFQLEIIWLDPVYDRIDAALLWRTSSRHQHWNNADNEKLQAVNERGSQLEIMQAFPTYSYNFLRQKASDLRLQRYVNPKTNPYHKMLAYSDLEAVQVLAGEDTEAYLSLVKILNQLAAQTSKQEMSAYWVNPIVSDWTVEEVSTGTLAMSTNRH